MIFLTVGTQFNFDRIVRVIDQLIGEGKITDTIYAQIGDGSYKPKNMQYSNILDKADFEQIISKSDGIISHCGIGSIITALNYNKPLLGVPRLKQFGELVNDHQLHTAKKFEQLGHILVAYNNEQLIDKISHLKAFKPKPRNAQPDKIAQKISDYIKTL